MSKADGNRFSRNTIKTLLFFSVLSFLFLDFLAANLYTLIKGYSLADSSRIELKKREEFERSFKSYSKVYHHDLKKNLSEANLMWGGHSYNLITNSLGFKDKKVRNILLTTDRHRVVFIGDSFTEGIGYPYEKTFVGIIDSELAKRGIDVLNAGVSSYSPIIYWKKIQYLIEKTGLRFNELVVFIDISDVEDSLNFVLDKSQNVKTVAKKYHVTTQADADFVYENLAKSKRLKEKFHPTENIPLILRENSILLYSLTKILQLYLSEETIEGEEFEMEMMRGSWSISEPLYNIYGRGGILKMQIYMNKLHSLLQKHNIKLTVAVYPWRFQIMAGDLDSVHVRIWESWCEEHEVDFVNYFPFFLTGVTPEETKALMEKYFIHGDSHWNERGHELVAQKFLSYYLERGFLNVWQENRSIIEKKRRALIQNPADLPSRLALARAFFDIQLYDKSISQYKKAEALNPENTEIYIEQAKVFSTLNDPESAINELTRALTLEPSNIEALILRGYAFADINDHQKSARDLGQSINLGAKDPEVFEMLKKQYALFRR